MNNKLALALLYLLSLAASPGLAKQASPSPESWISGTVIAQRKYSVTVAALGREWDIVIPDTAPVLLQLERPQFDLSQKKLSMEVWASGTRAQPETNRQRHFPLPDPCRIEVEFAHESERDRAMGQEIKRFVRYRLCSEAREQAPAAAPSPLRIVGRITDWDHEGYARVVTADGAMTAELGSREAYLAGRTLLDLEPFSSTVQVRVIDEDGALVAQEVHYRALYDPLSDEQQNLPRLLLLGDEVSLGYFAALKDELKDSFNLYHPPDNCRGVANAERLGEWLGPYHLPGRQWNVIALNFGLSDLTTPSAEYESGLKQCIEILAATGARLVWIDTAPVPVNYAARGEVADPAAEIQRLNDIAANVLAEFPMVRRIALHQWVHDQAEGELKAWWRGRNATFNAAHAAAVAKHLASELAK